MDKFSGQLVQSTTSRSNAAVVAVVCGGDVAGLTVGDPQLARLRDPILNQPGPGLGEGFPSPEHFQAPLAARQGPGLRVVPGTWEVLNCCHQQGPFQSSKPVPLDVYDECPPKVGEHKICGVGPHYTHWTAIFRNWRSSPFCMPGQEQG